MLSISWIDDESFEITLNGEYVTAANHDEHGWAGMDLAVDMVARLAEILGVDWEENTL